jgi:Na+-transporting methylmalonyl-CoA/oxaloacetate decarboxylase gamma subunit
MLAGLQILVVGIIVVMAVLCLLWASCAIMGFAFRTVEARQKAAEAKRAAKAQAEAEAQAQSQATPAGSGGIPPHHLAAIVAATAEVLQAPHRITRVWAPPPQTVEWSNQARLQTFNSHRRQGDWGRPVPALTRSNGA